MDMLKLREILKASYSSNLEFEVVEDEKNLMDVHHFYLSSTLMSEQEYNDVQKEVNNYIIDSPHYQLYFWSDGSGYDYWKGEDNYMLLSLYVKDFNDINLEELYKDIDTILEKFEDYTY